MGIDPEEVLVHDRVAASGRIEQAGAEQPLRHDQHEGNGQNRRRQDLHPGGRIE